MEPCAKRPKHKETICLLSDLPVELVDKITKLIDGADICRLIQCGNKYLNQLLNRGGVTRFYDMEKSIKTSFSLSLVYKFQKLETLECAHQFGFEFEKMDAKLLPSTLILI
jgi:hypothetical protein